MAKHKKKTKKRVKKKKLKKQHDELVRISRAYGHQGDIEIFDDDEPDSD